MEALRALPERRFESAKRVRARVSSGSLITVERNSCRPEVFMQLAQESCSGIDSFLANHMYRKVGQAIEYCRSYKKAKVIENLAVGRYAF
jgi:hypothetical protein